VLLAEVTNAKDAETVAEKVNAALALYSHVDSSIDTAVDNRSDQLVDNPSLRLRASVGISVYPEDGADPKTLIAFADAAMYLAKRKQIGAVAPHHKAPGLRAAPVPNSSSSPEPRQRPRSQQEAAHFEQMQEQAQKQQDLREANESLILAALGAQDLLAAAEEARRRQAALLALVADELSDPFAPIRLAASTLGIAGAEASLLPRVQLVIEQQADRLARQVRQVLEQPGRDVV
jgi:diguanylate cyclase